MRGHPDRQLPLFHTFDLEARIRRDHPLRDIKKRTDRILARLAPQFDAAYSKTGRPSVPPERILKALLLQCLYSIRSERQLCEQIDVNLLYRWFLDLQPGDEAFDPTVFPKNRERLETHGLAKAFFDAVVAEALAADLCSEHFSVDGTLIESYASAKSFVPKEELGEAGRNIRGEPRGADSDTPRDAGPEGAGFKPRNAEVDFRGRKRTNDTHASRTDPEAKLYRKGPGKEAKLAHMGHALAENRHGLIVAVAATEASGTAERDAAVDLMIDLHATHGVKPASLGADKGYDDGDFLQVLESVEIEPHVPVRGEPADPRTASDRKRRAGIEARQRMARRTGTAPYRASQRNRKKVEECFGWWKGVAGLDRSRWVGRWKLRQMLEVGAAAYNLVRLRRLKPA